MAGIYSRNIAWRFPTHYLSERCDSPFILSGVLLEDLSGSRVQSIDVDEYHRVNDERYKYFKTDLPTSALIVVKRLADEDLIVEIECVAVIPTERFKPTKSNDYGALAPAKF